MDARCCRAAIVRGAVAPGVTGQCGACGASAAVQQNRDQQDGIVECADRMRLGIRKIDQRARRHDLCTRAGFKLDAPAEALNGDRSCGGVARCALAGGQGEPENLEVVGPDQQA